MPEIVWFLIPVQGDMWAAADAPIIQRLNEMRVPHRWAGLGSQDKKKKWWIRPEEWWVKVEFLNKTDAQLAVLSLGLPRHVGNMPP